MKHSRNLILKMILFLVPGIFSACTQVENARREVTLSEVVPEIDKTREAKILTAFFGLDNGLTQRARILYRNAPGKDGMPIVFSLEVDPATLDAADFEVTTKNGAAHQVEAVTLLPAEEPFELRTVLLIGEYGNYPENPPVSAKIVGDLISRTGINFKGQVKEVIPLEEGPVLSYAEYYTFDEEYPYVEKGIGCDCPRESTQMVVKSVWAGGVRALSGEELGKNELSAFVVTMVRGTDTIHVTPFQLADLSDNDNNIDLCLKETGTPIKLEVDENIAMDPRDDPNPRTEIEVVSRW
jgi:hypothetical protein